MEDSAIPSTQVNMLMKAKVHAWSLLEPRGFKSKVTKKMEDIMKMKTEEFPFLYQYIDKEADYADTNELKILNLFNSYLEKIKAMKKIARELCEN